MPQYVPPHLPAAPGRPTAQQTSIAGYRYVSFVTGAAKADDTIPMLIGLHYSSASPEIIIADFGQIDFPAGILLPQGKYRRRGGYSWFPSDYGAFAASSQRTSTFQIPVERVSVLRFPCIRLTPV